jgi:hypothetical protein
MIFHVDPLEERLDVDAVHDVVEVDQVERDRRGGPRVVR